MPGAGGAPVPSMTVALTSVRSWRGVAGDRQECRAEHDRYAGAHRVPTGEPEQAGPRERRVHRADLGHERHEERLGSGGSFTRMLRRWNRTTPRRAR